jgi:hypothetical protein
MHFNFHFTAVQILWTLTFAAQLVLLVVLLGRDRVKRFPWFTIGIVMMALRLLASRLLLDRMSAVTLSVVFIIMADAAAVVGFLVVVEMARRAFAPARRGVWWAWALAVLVVGGAILAAWGRPWPAWKTLTADSFLASMNLLRMAAQKLDMLVDLLNVELGLLVVLFGRRFKAGWHSHVQRLVIGLATASAGQLAIEAIWQRIAMTAVPHSQAEYERVIGLREKLFNANGALYVAVLVWWIVVLWMEEPWAVAAEPPAGAKPNPEYLDTTSADKTANKEQASLAEQEAGFKE